jgi:hypothetical protein
MQVEGTGGVAQNRAGMRRKLSRRDECYKRLIPLELATPWLTDAGGVERCRRSEAERLHWGLSKSVFMRRNKEPYPIS